MKKLIILSFLGLVALLIGLVMVAQCATDGTPQSGSWLADNWYFIAVTVYAALSEIIGASPLKSNSVVGLIMQILGNLFRRGK